MIENLDSLNFKLDLLGDPKNVEKFLRRAGAMVEADAKRNCPVDTGNLRGSITHEVDGDTCAIGTNVEYAPYVHQGTGIYAADGTGRQDPWSYQDSAGNWHTTLGQPPRPFLTSALDQNREQITKIFYEMIEEAVK